ncbi:MAG: TetR/AcrR family transcriptional regulator [Gammaproteobacteria bacterium]
MTQTNTETRKERNPSITRQAILQAAFMEIFRNGYQGMRLENVMSETGLTKGALYHHFSNKQTLGYAVVDDMIQPMMQSIWIDPVNNADDPLLGLITAIEDLPDKKPEQLIEFGCPLNNLIQEMAPLDNGFRTRLDAIMESWLDTTEKALEAAVQAGQIRSDINCHETATFILASVEGCIGLAKSAQCGNRLRTCLKGITGYLNSLTVQSG